MNKTIFRNIFLVGAGLLGVLLIGALSFRQYNAYRFHVEKQTRFMMDTFVTLYAIGPQQKSALAVKEAFDRMQEIDSKFNAHNTDSAVYAFNHHNTPISDPEIVLVAAKALEISRLTGGAFDITIEPLIELWGFYGDTPSVPNGNAVQECLQKVGYHHLRVENGVLTKDSQEVKIDLGGIAKGYAVRQAADALKERGIASALIDAGGDVYALGKRGRDLWTIGIRNPRGDDLIGFMEVENMAVMGSGDYQRFFMAEGTRYHHIFDPKTGFPARGVRGTSLLHPDPMLADAWNTALFVLGKEKGLALIERMPNMEAVMITDTDDIVYSSGLSKALKINHQQENIEARRQ